MRLARFFTAAVIALCASACQYQSIGDPQLKGRDLELMALAAPMPGDLDPTRARYRVSNPTSEKKPGTIVVDGKEKFLYLIEENNVALRYPIAVGHEAYAWSGEATVGRKAEWPTWTPGREARSMNPGLKAFVPGGPENPLGARALYLYKGGRDTEYRIHGTNDPRSIGQNVSLGCIRMYNIDVIDLAARVQDGARVVVK